MPKSTQTSPYSPWDSQARLLLWLATCVPVLSFLFYFKAGEVLLYGDAIAHINIARRVFDSRTPGLLQLGTVWLPLPHLLMVPFLLSKDMWQRGVGGSIPSMAAYALVVVGIFRLLRGLLASDGEPSAAARIAPWVAALVFAANPNLIYMQTTAMGEALYLALFVWAVVYFSEWTRGHANALTKCGLCLAAACFTRYDGWFLTAAVASTVLIVNLLPSAKHFARLRLSRIALAKFILLTAAAPLLWFAYNGIVYRNPLEFENGPYSAKAIERRTETAGNPGHPGSGNLAEASLFFLKSGEINLAQNEWLQRTWVALVFAGIFGVAFTYRRESNPADQTSKALPEQPAWVPLLFLLMPVPFYALSVAYGGVPIFVPTWWPFSHYNVRYGLQLLPAFSVAPAVVVYFAIQRHEWNRQIRVAILALVFALVCVSYASVWSAGPICLKEAQINMRSRNELEKQLAAWLQKLPPESTLLIYLGDHVGALQQAGIPLNHTINEGNHRTWKQPVDLDGLWERALADPAQYADYAVASEGDTVWQMARARSLPALVVLHTTGQPPVIVYGLR
jgi:hypothetical protein